MTSIDLTEVPLETELRSAVAGIAGTADHAELLALADGTFPEHDPVWTQLTELGYAGLGADPDGGWAQAAIVAEALGVSLVGSRYLPCAIALALAQAAGHTALVAEIVSGSTNATVGFGWPGPLAAASAMTTTGDGRLCGTMPLVAAADADVLLAPVGSQIVHIDRAAICAEPAITLDMTRPLWDLRIDGAFEVVAEGRVAAAALRTAARIGGVLLAAEQLGIAERCLSTTVDYVLQRKPFGRQVGSFQAVKHRLAELWADIALARAVTRYAAGCAAFHDPDLPVAAALAQAVCSPLAQRAAETAVQLHGGIGFTWEHPLHLYLKRARVDAIALGSPAHFRGLLGHRLGLAPHGPGRGEQTMRETR